MKRLLWVASALFLLLSLSAQAGEGPVKLIEPTKAPAIHDSLADSQYATQLTELLAKFKPDQIDDGTPWAGAAILIVYPDLPAQSLGLKVGDVLVASNGEQVFETTDWVRHRRAGDHTATVWSPATGKREISTPPGLIGVGIKPYLRPEVLYLRELKKDQKADPNLFAAGACAQSMPSLARAVLAHLVKAGNADSQIYFTDAVAAFSQGNFDDAVASGMWAMHIGTDPQKRVLAPMMRSAALASFRLELAAQIEADYPTLKVTDAFDEKGKDLNVDLAKVIQRCNGLRWTSNDGCADALNKLKPTDETQNMASIGKAGAGGNQAAESIRKSHQTQFNAPDNAYELYVLGPPAANVKLTAKCRFSPSVKNPDKYGGESVKFGVTLKGRQNIMAISLALTCRGEVQIVGNNIPGCSCELPTLYTPGKPVDVMMIVVDHRCQIDINGARLFYGPILENEKSRQLCMVFQAVGVKGQLSQVKWETAGQP